MKKTVTIVCTGESLIGFDFTKIKTDIFVCNRARFYIPKHTKWIVWDRKTENRTWIDVDKIETISIHGGKWIPEGDKLNREKGKVGFMNNTLLFAINVAIQYGYKKIFILGADGKIDKYLHFWDREIADEYIRNLYKTQVFNFVRKKLELIKNELLEDEEIILVDSSYDMFKNITQKEYLSIKNEVERK